MNMIRTNKQDKHKYNGHHWYMKGSGLWSYATGATMKGSGGGMNMTTTNEYDYQVCVRVRLPTNNDQ